MVEWRSLLATGRPQDSKPAEGESQRTPFERDFDRVVFSSHFRRLQDKTQVHPLAESDYVRRRLTHSLEVSCVARSLGTFVGRVIRDRKEGIEIDEVASAVGQVTAAAALAHDIGNPPFGHIGEAAIGEWFSTNSSAPLFEQLGSTEKADLQKFEGNAQGFRILVRLANSRAGLKLTAATLGAFTKYPTGSGIADKQGNYIGAKKHGFFNAEQVEFKDTASVLGLKERGPNAWQRHPLAFLVEAADDICYRIIDVEDGVKVGRIDYGQAEECLRDLLPVGVDYNPDDGDRDTNLGWLRAKVIGNLIETAQHVFLESEREILAGTFSRGLIDASPLAGKIDEAKKLVVERVFKWDRTIRAEISGSKMLEGLLTDLVDAACHPERSSAKKLLSVVPGFSASASAYERLLSITDFVSGMTDSYLMQTHQQLHGLTMP